MKKFILSLFVVLSFVIYSLQQRRESSNNNIIVPSLPQNSQQNSPLQSNTNILQNSQNSYKDGSYVGSVADAYYGNIRVQITIQNGKITDVQFLQYPSDRRTSIMINSQAMPYLKQEAIQAQNANVDIVSGATDTSQAFIQSLQSALNKAKG